MGILKRLMGGESSSDEAIDSETETPSHVCESCGEEYFTNREYDIDTCRNCGGVKVKQA